MANLDVILDGISLPIVRAENFIELTSPNETTNQTLDGSIYTDYIGFNRAWEISWPRLTEDEYNSIRTIYMDQYVNHYYSFLEIPYYNVAVYAKLEIDNRNIKSDGCYVIDFSIRLKEQYSVS